MAVPHHDSPSDPDGLFQSCVRELAATPGRAALLVIVPSAIIVRRCCLRASFMARRWAVAAAAAVVVLPVPAPPSTTLTVAAAVMTSFCVADASHAQRRATVAVGECCWIVHEPSPVMRCTPRSLGPLSLHTGRDTPHPA
jgi:hypothetical protein